MGFLFIIGVLLIVCYFDIDKNVKKNCTSDKLRDANTGLLVIGMIFISITTGKMMCNWKCDCPSESGGSSKLYIAFVFVLSIVLLTLSSIIKAEGAGKSCPLNTKSTDTILGLSICLIILSGGYLGYSAYLSFQTGGMMFTGVKSSLM